MAKQKTYNPCDDCRYSFSRNNQESGMCKICELEYFKDRLLDARTADVIPKSEVERLNKELDELAEEHSDLIVEKDQLFDIAEKQKIEIESLKIANEKMYSAIEETKAEVEREIFEEIEHEMFICDPDYSQLYHKFAELKKKYTEGET